MWTGHTAGYIARVKSDGTGFQVVLIDDNTYGVDIIEKTGSINDSKFLEWCKNNG